LRLLVVSPGGLTHLLCRGSKNLAFPGDLSEPRPIKPAQSEDVEIPLLAASCLIPAGWRLRLAIAGADFPVLWPPAERFELSVDPTVILDLPVVLQPGQPLHIPPSPPLEETPVAVMRSDFDFKVVHSQGTTSFSKVVGHREQQPTGLAYDTQQHFSVFVDDEDPATTSVEARTAIELERDNWLVGCDSTMRITADRNHFHIAIHLSASEDDAVVFDRDWTNSIERRWA
jgi:hypothetical protein